MSAANPAATVRNYRGSIGNSHIEMRLQADGDQISGSYTYDRIGQDIKLAGHKDHQGRLELKEYDTGGKQTGSFVCKRELDDPVDSECTWSKPHSTDEILVVLHEQYIAFSNGLRVVPKLITNRKSGVDVSYPQLIGGSGSTAAAVERFNRRVTFLATKAIKEFEPGGDPGRNSFDTNYTILFGTNDLVSVEMYEESDSGGAHPNDRYWTVNYDLAANRELKLEELFKPKSDYQTAISKYVATDINKRVDQLEQDEAKREGRPPKPPDDPLVSDEQLFSQIEAFAITPKGLMIYFDFPHVMSVFDKNFVPYSIVSGALRRPLKRP